MTMTARRAAVLGSLGALVLVALAMAATVAVGPSSPRADVATRAPSNGPRPVPASAPAVTAGTPGSIERWREDHAPQLRRVLDDAYSASGGAAAGAYEGARRSCRDLEVAVGAFAPTAADPGPPPAAAPLFGSAMAELNLGAGECVSNTTNPGAWGGDFVSAYQVLRGAGLWVAPDAWATR